MYCRASLSVAAGLHAQSPAAPPAGLDAYVARAMSAFTVPGVAVTVVKNGQVVVAKGRKRSNRRRENW